MSIPDIGGRASVDVFFGGSAEQKGKSTALVQCT